MNINEIIWYFLTTLLCSVLGCIFHLCFRLDKFYGLPSVLLILSWTVLSQLINLSKVFSVFLCSISMWSFLIISFSLLKFIIWNCILSIFPTGTSNISILLMLNPFWWFQLKDWVRLHGFPMKVVVSFLQSCPAIDLLPWTLVLPPAFLMSTQGGLWKKSCE